jgi:hypothetical protein
LSAQTEPTSGSKTQTPLVHQRALIFFDSLLLSMHLVHHHLLSLHHQF